MHHSQIEIGRLVWIRLFKYSCEIGKYITQLKIFFPRPTAILLFIFHVHFLVQSNVHLPLLSQLVHPLHSQKEQTFSPLPYLYKV